jgi:hypothetical protein
MGIRRGSGAAVIAEELRVLLYVVAVGAETYWEVAHEYDAKRAGMVGSPFQLLVQVVLDKF